MVVTLGQQYNIGEKPTLHCTLILIAMQGHQNMCFANYST